MKYAMIKSPIAALCKEPRADSPLEDEALYGMKVELLSEEAGGWFLVQTHYHYRGYVNLSDLILDEALISKWDQAARLIVTHSYADVLSLPKFQGIKLISLTRGAQLICLKEADPNGWVRVMLCDGTTGFMKDKFLGAYIDSIYADIFPSDSLSAAEFLMAHYGLSESGFRSRVVETALLYLNTQYRWGGKSSLGIDCSGLCSISYMLNGILIYRDASIKEGFLVKEIPFMEKKPGDLVFFEGHVAMYIGGGRYVHSTGKNGCDGVVINSFDPKSPDYRPDLMKIMKETGSIFI